MGKRRGYKTLHPIERDAAIYFAGLFDGEGCVCLAEYHPRYGGKGQVSPYFRAQMSVSNTHHGVLLHIQRTIGGIIGKPVHRGKPRRPLWRWSAASRESAHIIRHILPFLVIKKQQALLLLEFHESVQDYIHLPHPGNLGCPQQTPAEIERRRRYLKRMQALNHAVSV
jgi:hypothetical protein